MGKQINHALKEKNNVSFNHLPVKTWRWLKLNERMISDGKFPEVLPFSKPSVVSGDDQNMMMEETAKGITAADLFIDSREYGVSKEYVQLGEKFANAGMLIRIPKKERLSEPIHIQYTMSEKEPMLNDFHVIILEENSEATVVLDYATVGEHKVFHNGTVKIHAKEGSVLHLVQVQRMNDKSNHFYSVLGIVESRAVINYTSAEIGAAKSVTSYVAYLDGENGESNLKSVYLGDGDRMIDMNYLMKHKGRRSTSSIETRGALKDRAIKVFRGTLDFQKGASRAKGSEEEYVMLLDKSVKADAVPILLCAEDDVDGMHAASAGQIEEEKLFYLMSRGLSEKEAKKLIVEASCRPILDTIPIEELRKSIDAEMNRRLVYD